MAYEWQPESKPPQPQSEGTIKTKKPLEAELPKEIEANATPVRRYMIQAWSPVKDLKATKRGHAVR